MSAASALVGADVVHVLGLEALALRVTSALEREGIAVLLLKGPVTNRWLYGNALARRFCDIDLLVAPGRSQDAAAVLAQLGFRDDHARVLGIYRPNYETSWSSDAGSIDLHTRLGGIPAGRADDAWERLNGSATTFPLHGRTVRTLDETARIMLLALHAARSSLDAQALRDLDLGLAELPEASWQAAADLAADLGAEACFALGLRRRGAGRALLERLGFTAAPTYESLLLERPAPQQALVVVATLQIPEARARAAAVLRWFRTEDAARGSWRAVVAAAARLPRALFLVVRARAQLRRIPAVTVEAPGTPA